MSENNECGPLRSLGKHWFVSAALAIVAGCEGEPHVRAKTLLVEQPREDASLPAVEAPDAEADVPDAAQAVDAIPAGPRARFSTSEREVAESAGRVRIAVELDAISDSEVELGIEVAGSANEGVDCAPISRTLSIAAGALTADLSFSLTDDDLRESTETLLFTLASARGAELGEGAVFTLSIVDDDERAWPGPQAVVTRDQSDVFGVNMSGVTYQPAAGPASAVLWLVQNSPSMIYKLARSGADYVFASDNQWGAGKRLLFSDGTGEPDAEGVTKALWDDPAIYVASERDGPGDSAPTVLRYDSAQAGTELVATHAWDLTSDLPVVSANLGIEAISWLPDAHLVAHRFFDEHTRAAYDPSLYPGHGAGLFVVGLEANGSLYVYALDHTTGSATRVATIESGQPAAMGLEFDRDSGLLWSHCDDTCGNVDALLQIDEAAGSATAGRFRPLRFVSPPSGLPAGNHEGFALAPDSECAGGSKAAFWLEDGPSEGHTLREGRVDCDLDL